MTYLRTHGAPSIAPPAPTVTGVIYTCPMHPQIRQVGPGNCPICGMTLEPVKATAEVGENHELTDMTRRFWVGFARGTTMGENEHAHALQSEKDDAVADINLVLDMLADASRNPDPWERSYLVHAISALFAGFYRHAAVDARSALRPHSERKGSGVLIDPALELCDPALLRKALEAARTEPLQLYPHFGPIELR